jgi:hypothetical protein
MLLSLLSAIVIVFVFSCLYFIYQYKSLYELSHKIEKFFRLYKTYTKTKQEKAKQSKMKIINSVYQHNYQLYCATFPFEWAQNHLEGTGPIECITCETMGSINGVFVGYCIYCADDYHAVGEHRGNGMVEVGVELTYHNYDCYNETATMNSLHEELYKYLEKGAFETYLEGVDLKEINEK